MDKEIILDFICYGKHMVVVKLEHGTHVMYIDEWKRTSKKRHLEHRDKKRKYKTA